jgi:CBS domain containing-hemolysin-like protein
MESVLLSTTLSFLKVKEEKGHGSASVFIRLKRNVDQPLSAILTLNTIAHTIGAAGVGAQATRIFGDTYFGIISAVLTLLILVFSEIIPKTIGARYWRRLALPSGIVIKAMVIMSYPIVIILHYITRLFSGKSKSMPMSREEISAMAKIGTKQGVLQENENRIIQNLVQLNSVKASDIMTPRVVVTSADANMSLEEFLSRKEFLYYSRIPIYLKNKENIIGFVLRQHVFEKLAEKQTDLILRHISREIVVGHEFQSVMNLWETLLVKKEHLALIVDEYGGMAGIVTMEDIIETLLGLEIVDERDRIVDMQQYARKRWKEKKAKYNMIDA